MAYLLSMAANLTENLLRSVLQLPTRPYSDIFPYDSSPYYDLTRREPVSILTASGTASGSAHNFVMGTDFHLTAGVIDWTLPGTKPDYGTAFTINYTYSRLGSSTASTSMWTANLIVTQDLGMTFPYNIVTPQGIAYNDLATYAQALVACRESCKALSSSDIDVSEKARRGSVLVDDTKKWEDWDALAKEYEHKYRRFLTVVRPGGQISSFQIASQFLDAMVLDSDFTVAPPGRLGTPYDSSFGGVL